MTESAQLRGTLLHDTADQDPREALSAEVIDLASRTAYPAVASRKPRSDAMGLVAGVAVIALLGGATLWGLNAARTDDTSARTAAQADQAAELASAQAQLQEAQAALNAQQAGLNAVGGTEGALSEAPLIQPDPAPSPILAAPPAPGSLERASRFATPTVVYDASLPAGLAGAAAAGIPATPDQAGAGGAGASANDFASRIGGVGGGTAVARSDFDPATTVTQGTLIPAVLETAIDTDVPGYARAIVAQDVRSYDGKAILIPRSSRLIGQYQSGLQAGQKRAYVIWTRLIRPDGVSVALASPATGFDGRTGIEGKVNSHFFQRLGSAMLLTVVGGLTSAIGGTSSVIVGGGQSAASTALQQSGQISPTVRVRQGEPIRVYTARDLDFSRAPRI